jgi:hypothetical protein
MATFTKNKKTDAYDVIGTIEEMCIGNVEVSKKDGTTTYVCIGRLSREFTAKFGPLKGKKCKIGTIENRTERGGNLNSEYCGFPCPVTKRRCCAKNGPCHDCRLDG